MRSNRTRRRTVPTDQLPALTSKDDFLAFQQRAQQQWDAMWNGDRMVVSVGIGSSSIAKGALAVLDACRTQLGDTAIVRETSGNGAFWMEPWIEVQRPHEPPVLFGPLAPDDVPGVLAGAR